MTLYEELLAAGIEIDHHESDLYVKDTAEVRTILERYPTSKANAERFHVQDGHPNAGETWLDIPFAYHGKR